MVSYSKTAGPVKVGVDTLDVDVRHTVGNYEGFSIFGGGFAKRGFERTLRPNLLVTGLANKVRVRGNEKPALDFILTWLYRRGHKDVKTTGNL